MTTLRFTVPGRPIPCGRPKVARGGRRTFMPARTQDYKKTITEAARAALEQTPNFDANAQAYAVSIVVWRAVRTGDWDNFGKSVCDAVNAVAYPDDRLIEDGHVQLRIDRKNPRVDVEIWPVDPFEPRRR